MNYPDHLLHTLDFYRRLLNSGAPLAEREEIVTLLEELEASAASADDTSTLGAN